MWYNIGVREKQAPKEIVRWQHVREDLIYITRIGHLTFILSMRSP
ncbi:gp137 [Brochothrix phage A9]|uniref:Gp137 n=1 Tax=Brochothrix phage A9 TaxID=857312 RepID=D9J0T4_9CAUD|nr:gp137 [Brochothrix phage A9]ADJ53171.1 gp137 [Brochothrix phage A9]